MNRSRLNHTEILPPYGNVLVAGGSNHSCNTLAIAELYDRATGTWTRTSSLNTARKAATATLLAGGKVLAADNYSDNPPGLVLG